MSEWIVTNMEFDEAYAEMYGYKRLVRCRDCKHYAAHQGKGMFCTKTVGAEYPREPEEYCSDGERRL